MTDINLYKSYTRACFASSRRLRDIHVSKLVTVGQSKRRTTIAVAPIDGEYLASYPTAIVMFVSFQRLLVEIAA